jgi:hypothetical protein
MKKDQNEVKTFIRGIFETLDEPCRRCGGTGKSRTDDPGYLPYCQVCNGNGYIQSEFGEMLLAYLARNQKKFGELVKLYSKQKS